MKIRIGSFNIKNWSRASNKDLEKLRDIIDKENLDIVSFQEILSEGFALKNFVEKYLPKWECYFSQPPESRDSDKARDRRGEGYAFIWNAKKFKYSSSPTEVGEREFTPRIINRKETYYFARMPLYGRFTPVNGGFFELRLVNVHLCFCGTTNSDIQKRKDEYEVLIKDVYPLINEKRYGNNRAAYTIIMGDYNLNLRKFRGDLESRINSNTYIDSQMKTRSGMVSTVQDELTSLRAGTEDEPESRGYSNNYDHFSLDTDRLKSQNIGYKVNRIDAVRKYYNDDFLEYNSNISDHVPIVIELNMNEEEPRVYEMRGN